MPAKPYSHGIGWLAGEASGDYLASLILSPLQEATGAQQYGIGGEKMVAAGLNQWFSSDRLSVRGVRR